ncbi:hypothetical protein ACTPEM_23195, partial [Clostridioides difficile]
YFSFVSKSIAINLVNTFLIPNNIKPNIIKTVAIPPNICKKPRLSGTNIKAIYKILVHADIKIAMNIYSIFSLIR